ncbi:MAG: hypothetical protein ACYC7I_11660, partial [Gammaproteobacteria bacterium]
MNYVTQGTAQIVNGQVLREQDHSRQSPQQRLGALRVALVHEWYAAFAGSERVVEQLLKVFPQADLYALVDF